MTFLFLALAGGVLVVWVYHRREVPVPGRWLLAGARVLSLTLILLLLWNPRIPAASGEGEPPWLLLDGSLSMTATAESPGPWERALQRVQADPWGGVLVFGDRSRAVAPDTVARMRPDALRSLLEPALESAAEAGARRVVVVSDFRIPDLARAKEKARSLGVHLTPEALDADIVNAGLAEVAFPEVAESDAPFQVSAVLFAEGLPTSDSLDVEVREAGRLVASRRVRSPRPGILRRVELTLPAPGGAGVRRYVTSVSASGDVFPDDDGRPAWIEIDPQERGVLVLSLRPDWEPRFLLPILERVTGLRGEAFLGLGQGRFMTTVEGSGRPRILSAAEVRQRLEVAQILVVHGVGADSPSWVGELMENTRRLVVLPVDPKGARLAGLTVGSPLPGEWYAHGSLPPSPLAGDLAGVDLSRLPPLTGILPLGGGEAASVPLLVERQGRGSREAGMALLEVPRGRRAVVLGQGLWRWAFREGSGREVYRRLWAGVAGWLLAGEGLAEGREVRPREWVIPRGRRVSWQAPGHEGDSLRILVSDSTGSVVVDTLVVAGADGFTMGPLPPGMYSFRAATPADPGGPAGEGFFDVESFTEELMALPATLGGAGEPASDGGNDRETGRPLRTHPLPYLLVLALLSAEWIGRRRKGLR